LVEVDKIFLAILLKQILRVQRKLHPKFDWFNQCIELTNEKTALRGAKSFECINFDQIFCSGQAGIWNLFPRHWWND
jgi:hypothetical protein